MLHHIFRWFFTPSLSLQKIVSVSEAPPAHTCAHGHCLFPLLLLMLLFLLLLLLHVGSLCEWQQNKAIKHTHRRRQGSLVCYWPRSEKRKKMGEGEGEGVGAPGARLYLYRQLTVNNKCMHSCVSMSMPAFLCFCFCLSASFDSSASGWRRCRCLCLCRCRCLCPCQLQEKFLLPLIATRSLSHRFSLDFNGSRGDLIPIPACKTKSKRRGVPSD